MQTDDSVVEAVWEKGRGMAEKDSSEWRKDQCGAWIQRTQFNNPNSEYGWTIVNVQPGAEDTVENLHPLHFSNSFNIAMGKPQCRVTADRSGVTPTQNISQPRNAGI